MLTATLKSLMARKVRLIMSAIAVILGVAFVAGSMIFSATLRSTFDGILAGTTAEVVVRQQDSNLTSGPIGGVTISERTARRIAAVDGVARADGIITDMSTTFLDKDGKAMVGGGMPNMAYNWHEGPNLEGQQPFSWVSGRAPQRQGEVGVDETTATKAGFVLGDKVTLLTSGAHPRITATVVGIGRYNAGGMAGASLAYFDTRTAQKYYLDGARAFQSVGVTAADGLSQTELRDRVAATVPAGFEAVTGDQQADEAAESIADSVSFLNNFLLIFAGIALFVGAFLIINTFSILVAQRGRELALYRALGAQRRQVTASVIVEAVIVGLVGATLGLALGVVLAFGITWLFALIGLDLSTSSLVFTPMTVVVAYLVGVLVTVAAAWLPAYRAGKVSPMAAMREDVVVEEGSMRSRIVVGVTAVVLGAVAMGLGLFTSISNGLVLVGAGMFAVLLGVAMTSPVLGRPILAAAGWVLERAAGMVGRMANQNTLRNPRRTAATASALMIGMTLVTTLSIFGQSAKASVDAQVEETMQADYMVSQLTNMPFAASISDDLRGIDGVATVSTLRYPVGMTLDGQDVVPDAVDPATFRDFTVAEGVEGTDRPALGTVLVGSGERERFGLKLGDTVAFEYGPRRLDLRVTGFYEDIPAISAPAFIMTQKDVASIGVPPRDNVAYVMLDPGADRAAVSTQIDAVLAQMPLISAKDKVEYAAEQRGQFDNLLVILYALLGLAVVIAVLGIINTLGLSVIERTREFGMLRAIGLRRDQLGRMVTLESVVIAVLGALMGTGLGLLFGVALQQALKDDGFRTMSIPWLQIVLTLVIAGLVGVVAAVAPARRASRLQILEAIRTE
ncbi:ABC transporter permease [Kribbia dieselivorans]|uniref:ABC transporter permease n=1 Tax=Kribbia dieselivorans TaxID=331526 RepID=UPI0008394F32|nr:ABC transporter permease [Kribbia dieselivorans]